MEGAEVVLLSVEVKAEDRDGSAAVEEVAIVLFCVKVAAVDEAASESLVEEVWLLKIDEASTVTGFPNFWQAF